MNLSSSAMREATLSIRLINFTCSITTTCLRMAVAVLHEVPHANPHGQTLHDCYFESALSKSILTRERTELVSQSTESRSAHMRSIYHNKVENGFITLVDLHHLMTR